jgi:hypothetical protein
MGARVAQQQVAQRIVGGLQKRLRDPGRQRDAEGVSIPRRVLDRDVPWLAREAHLQHAPCRDQRLHAAGDRRVGRARQQLVPGEVADGKQQVVDRVGASGPVSGSSRCSCCSTASIDSASAAREARRRRAARELALIHGERLGPRSASGASPSCESWRRS